MTLLLIVLLMIGAARITWFITEDHLPFVQRPRDWIINRNPDGNLAYLVNCWWCSSVYVGAGAAAFGVWVMDIDLVPEDWKSFLTLWPAIAFGAVLFMLIADVLMAHGTPDE